jgi:hypothetical protein
MSKLTPIASNCSEQEYETASSIGHPSLQTLEPPILAQWPAWWISSLAASPVSLIRRLENEKAPQTTETSGLTRSELSVRWDQDTSYWRTSQASFLHLLTGEDQRMGEPWSESLPPSGTVSIGKQSVLTMWAHPTGASDGGVSGWPTPRTSEVAAGMTMENVLNRVEKTGYHSNLEEAVAMMGNWPTPRKVDWKGSGPTVIRKDGKSRMDKLVYLAEQSQHGPLAPVTQTDGSECSESDQTSPQPSPKRLNVNVVSWLMGVPIGWTSLKPLEMASYRQWWQSFSGG